MLIHSPADLAQYYRDQRKQRGLSQVAVADEIAVRQDTVSRFELKPDNVRMDTLFRLLAALDMELHIVPKGQSPSVDGAKQGWAEPW
ncbi:MAG: helix-turn-helix domain-containing protein [Halomonas sp.]|nr:helix-turn-helix domain-containing protein [Halomonas sp.]